MPAVIVADAASRSGLAAIRSLDRAGAPVVAVDHRANAIGFRSRLALSLYAPPPSAASLLVERLAELGRALARRSVLLPTSLEYLAVLAAARDRLSPLFHCAFPESAVVDAVAAAGARDDGEGVAVAAHLEEDGEARTVFVRGRGGDHGDRDDASATAALDRLRRLGLSGPGWAEVDPGSGEVFRAGAYLWPQHGLAAAAGVDLPRIAYWSALGARLPQSSSSRARRGRLDRRLVTRDPGPGLPVSGALVRRLRS